MSSSETFGRDETYSGMQILRNNGFITITNQHGHDGFVIDGDGESFKNIKIHSFPFEINGVPCATACSFSNTGTGRDNNQDRVVIVPWADLFAVMDAYGDSGNEIAKLLSPEWVKRASDNVGRIISETYARMKSIAPTLPDPPLKKQKGGICCGLCRIEMQGEKMMLQYHRIGDVTIIIIKKNAEPKRTVDQVNEKGRVTNAISADEERTMETVTESVQLRVGDIVIIGSDGVLKGRDTQRLIDEIAGKNAIEIARYLANQSDHRRDNVSAAVVEINQIPSPQNAREDEEGDEEGDEEEKYDRYALKKLMDNRNES